MTNQKTYKHYTHILLFTLFLTLHAAVFSREIDKKKSYDFGDGVTAHFDNWG